MLTVAFGIAEGPCGLFVGCICHGDGLWLSFCLYGPFSDQINIPIILNLICRHSFGLDALPAPHFCSDIFKFPKNTN
jgi:hypothetical protein